MYHPLTRVKAHGQQESEGFVFIFPESSTVPGIEKVPCILVWIECLSQQVFIKLLLWAQWVLGSVIHKRSVTKTSHS